MAYSANLLSTTYNCSLYIEPLQDVELSMQEKHGSGFGEKSFSVCFVSFVVRGFELSMQCTPEICKKPCIAGTDHDVYAYTGSRTCSRGPQTHCNFQHQVTSDANEHARSVPSV